MTSDGPQIGKRSHLDWWAPLAVCSCHTLVGCFSRNRERSLTNAGHRRGVYRRKMRQIFHRRDASAPKLTPELKIDRTASLMSRSAASNV